VPPASDRNEQIVLFGEVHRRDDVGDPRTLDDKRWVSVDHAVPHGPGIVIVRVRGLHQPTSQDVRQSRDGLVGNRCGLPVTRAQFGVRHSISVQAIGRHDPAYGCTGRSVRAA
jgi:hypothetical protein